MAELKLANKFQVGCDPEFLLLDKAGKVMAGFEAVREIAAIPPGLGHDGSLMELRPNPSRSTWELTKNLRNILVAPGVQQSDMFKKYKWKAGAYFQGIFSPDCTYGRQSPTLDANVPIGGHVHIEIIPKEATPAGFQAARNPKLVKTLQKALDCGVRCLEKLEILPHKEMMDRRNKGGYGKTTDCIRFSCSNRTYEYRRMCSWLFHPNVTFLCLTLAKMIALNPLGVTERLIRPYSFMSLENLASAFASKDDDARRLYEMLWPHRLAAFQHDASQDFKQPWLNWRP